MQRRRTETAFLSEHSIEFVLVPRIIEILSTDFPNVIPMRFQMTREGSLVSRDVAANTGERVSLIAVFARRPKVLYGDAKTVLIKFNELLFDYAQLAENYNIPVLAGAPIISRLSEFNKDCNVVWFKINSSDSQPYSDTQMRFDVESGQPIGKLEINSIEIITNIPHFLMPKLNWITWNNALDTMRELRQRINPTQQFYLGGVYQPFYLVIPYKKLR